MSVDVTPRDYSDCCDSRAAEAAPFDQFSLLNELKIPNSSSRTLRISGLLVYDLFSLRLGVRQGITDTVTWHPRMGFTGGQDRFLRLPSLSVWVTKKYY